MRSRVKAVSCNEMVLPLVEQYVERLELPTADLWLTTDRVTYGSWLKRHIPVRYGGAYCFLRHERKHAVLINLERIDLAKPKALEIVVAEELVHMRDHLDGDFRRHSHHGHDRIAHRVASLTGATLEEIRGALIPVARKPLRYVYACPGCQMQVERRRKGTWSCGRCSPVFDAGFQMQLVLDRHATS